MPGSVSLTGDDVINLNGRIFVDLATGDIGKLTYPDDLGKTKVGKDGNIIFALNESGRMVELEVVVLMGSSDDAFLNSIMQTFLQDVSGFILMTGALTKRVGDGQGNVQDVVYQLAAGIPKRMPDVKINTEGDTSQSQAVWRITFGSGEGRIIT